MRREENTGWRPATCHALLCCTTLSLIPFCVCKYHYFFSYNNLCSSHPCLLRTWKTIIFPWFRSVTLRALLSPLLVIWVDLGATPRVPIIWEILLLSSANSPFPTPFSFIPRASRGRWTWFLPMRHKLSLDVGKAFVFLTQESYLFSPYSPRIQNTDLMAGAILAVLWLLWKGHETHKDLLADVLKLMNQPSNQLPLYFLYVKQNKIKTNLELFKPLYLSR